MPMFIFENMKSREIASADAVNESKARLDLGEEWHLARLVPHSDAQKLFNETVADERAANLSNATKLKLMAKQLKTRRETLAQIVARVMKG